ncbi:MAG: spore cortex biosynthesis protein YabQ [Lachnospiraceae bacterium]|nr:spore cortex biosynthesis protein YabQ [Lachnospiraceae bacterium]
MAELIYDEIQLFLICLMLGAALALVYDGIRIFRLLIPHQDWVVDVEDLVYWVFTAWMVFRTLFYYNQGMLRGYAFLGMFLGMLVYMLTVSRLLLFIVRKLLPYWEKIHAKLQKPLLILQEKMRKSLKNIASEVKMAMKSR